MISTSIAIRRTIAAAALLCPSAALAQYASPGGASYSLERWEEDYSHLKNATEKKDFFDPIKYVPLTESGSCTVSFGGQARYRFDYFNNPAFGPGTNDEDGFHLQRYLVHADAHFGENVRAFVQLDSSFVDGRTGGGRTGDANQFDIQQAFVDLKTSDDSDPFAMLRIGRQELVYGAQRLISPDDWRNVRRSFDGAKLSLSVSNDTLDIFLVRPVFIERDQFDNDDPATFAGIYNAMALPDVIEGGNSKLETYLLALYQTRHTALGADVDTYTAGARFSTKPKPWDFDIEGDYQFGSNESSNISAWSIATEGGYTFSSVEFSPRIYAGFDAASGSADGDGRFNQLFPPTYMYLGHLYIFGRSNIVDAHVGVDLHLTNDVSLYITQHAFWRQNTDDAVYNLTRGVVRADNGSDEAYLGNEFDIALTWQIDKHISAYMGWAHFFTGDFFSDTGASKDVDFLYASMTYTF